MKNIVNDTWIWPSTWATNTASCIIMISANKFELLENLSHTLDVSSPLLLIRLTEVKIWSWFWAVFGPLLMPTFSRSPLGIITFAKSRSDSPQKKRCVSRWQTHCVYGRIQYFSVWREAGASAGTLACKNQWGIFQIAADWELEPSIKLLHRKYLECVKVKIQ